MSSDHEWAYLGAKEVGDLIQSGHLTSLEVTEAQLARIGAFDPTLRSYVTVMADDALKAASLADAELKAGRVHGPLHGVPIGIKDLCWTAGVPTTAGMAIHRQFIPDEDATVVRRLREGGAIVLGKLQLSEGAYSDHHPEVCAPINPWHRDYWSGISSSGSGVAVAAGLCYAAIGTDTGGSIRWPAAATGVTGIKPTWGRVSRHGVFALAPTLDHVGTMARSAMDAGLMLRVIAGHDDNDPTSLMAPALDDRAYEDGVAGLRMGFDPTWNEVGVELGTWSMVASAVAAFVDLGAEIVEVTLPDPASMIADWAPACAVEAAVEHEATYDEHRSRYGAVLSSVIENGRVIKATDLQRIILRRLEFRGRLEAAMRGVDLVIMPVQPVAPLSLETIRTLGEQPELIAQLQRYTCPFDMTGHPTITLPGGMTDLGLPLGFQLVADHLREDLLIRAGVAYQSQTSWHRRTPVLS